jgi:DNA-binding GntR family transcriptional regulator
MNKDNKEIYKYPLPRTMSEFIYLNLKEAILANQLKANERINEKELAKQFHVSRTPVREAVLRLAAEGFVKIDSYRRAIVREISYEELREILEVLSALDRLAISLAIDCMTQNDINKLDKITERMNKACKLNKVEKYMSLNAEFHNELWKFVPNKILREILYLVRDKKDRYSYARTRLYRNPGCLSKSMHHHRQLMEAIKSRDRKRLMNLVVEHRSIILESKDHEEQMRQFISTGEGIPSNAGR